MSIGFVYMMKIVVMFVFDHSDYWVVCWYSLCSLVLLCVICWLFVCVMNRLFIVLCMIRIIGSSCVYAL